MYREIPILYIDSIKQINQVAAASETVLIIQVTKTERIPWKGKQRVRGRYILIDGT
jgi:hypothetical protein